MIKRENIPLGVEVKMLNFREGEGHLSNHMESVSTIPNKGE